MKKPARKVVASVEARMGSSRLPGKVLEDIYGKPAIERLLARLKKCSLVDDIVLATSTSSADDGLASFVKGLGIKVFRGSEEDVLSRVVGAHRSVQGDIIVEVTGDCPLLDPDVIDMGVRTYLENDCDVVSNTARLSFPQGADVQVFSLEKLAWVEENINDPAVREHVSLYFYENEDRYRIIHLQAPPRWYGPDLRFQLDYPEDLAFIRAVYRELLPQHKDGCFGVEEVMALLRRKPDISSMNSSCVEKAVR